MIAFPRAKTLASFLATILALGAFTPVAADEVPAAETANETDDGSRALPVPERWVAPPPAERPLMDILEGIDAGATDPERAKTVRDVSMSVGIAGLCAGTVVAASGFYRIYSASRFGPDMGAINDGIGVIISGSLISAVSSMFVSAASARE